jgi:2-amino-4-hydroxy-6-hydroxymethyldihydropteridine diphosphokinase
MYGNDVFIGLGGNLPSEMLGPPLAVMAAALRALPATGIVVRRRSRWYRSAPVPASDQPTYINGVLEVETQMDAAALLQALHRVEADFGRVRGAPNAARVLDLDLLAFGRSVVRGEGGLTVPHPRMHLRAFVLKPLAELAPEWRHPQLGLTTTQLLAALPPGQWAEPLDESIGEAGCDRLDLPCTGGRA